MDDLATAQFHLADPMRLYRIPTIAQIFDQKHTRPRNGHQDLAGPFARNVRGAHHQCRAGPTPCQHVYRPQRHESLARTAFRDDARRPGVAKIFRGTGNGQCLRRERLAE